MKISAVIITFNEERNIAACLQSLVGIVDEILVLDSLSTDKTKEICESFPVKFHEQAFLGYAQQKNKANKMATNDWIFSIDADEVVSCDLKASISALKENEIAVAYQVKRLTNYCGKWIYHCGWYPDTKIRIFNRKYAKWTGDFIHEKISFDIETNIETLGGDLLHYSYHSVTDHIKQADKFTSLTALEAYNKNKKASLSDILLRPLWKFIRDYFFKAGFLDGYAGYMVCKISAFATFLKYTKLRELQLKITK